MHWCNRLCKYPKEFIKKRKLHLPLRRNCHCWVYPIKVKIKSRLHSCSCSGFLLSASLFEVRFVLSSSAWFCAKGSSESKANWSEGGTEWPSGRRLKGRATQARGERRGEERKKERSKVSTEKLLVTEANKIKCTTHSRLQHLPPLAFVPMWHRSTVYWVISLNDHQGPAASQQCTEVDSHTETLFWTDWYSWSRTAEQNTVGQRLHPLQSTLFHCLTPLTTTHTVQVQKSRCFPVLLVG